MNFTRLRLSGFKSFVEPTELFVEPGLTAIVGPNGCGKSNLFDAMRWVMGETRPTSIRGGEMDDMIFAGSAGRPSRNMAEVSLFIDNSDRSIGGAYGEFDAIEVSRRIEREAGSVYRINGRDVRQRDVQIFFADASSGAGSTAFIRQGQIGMICSQKPLARRAILEEAAGISGLHARRHEAELRLRAAETNLSRLEDIIREVEGQLQGLKRQARQASRYRNLSGLIRKAEALALHIRWTGTEAQARLSQGAFEAAVAAVEEATGHAARTATVRLEAASGLPALRHAEAEKSAALHRLTLERETLDAEEARAKETAQRLRQRIGQAKQDLEREQTLQADAQAALEALVKEQATLQDETASASAAFGTAQRDTARSAEALAQAEQALDRLTSELAEWNALKASHERSRDVSNALAETSCEQLEEARSRLREAMKNAAAFANSEEWDAKVATARETAEKAGADVQAAREELQSAERAEADARGPLDAAERDFQHLSAEEKVLADLLRPRGEDRWPPLVDSVQVQPGYEGAFAAALGDDVHSPLDESAPHHWRDLGSLGTVPPLPAGARTLREFVEAPPALDRLLTMTGLVFPDQGAALQAYLVAGQRLVSARGDVWRWDGFASSAEAQSPAAVRLAQRNRLDALKIEVGEAETHRASLADQHRSLAGSASALRSAVGEKEAAHRTAQASLVSTQTAAAEAARAAAENMSQLASLEAELRRLTQARDAALEASRVATEKLSELGDGADLMEALAQARTQMASARAADGDSRAALESLKREMATRSYRITVIAEDEIRWRKRSDNALQQIGELGRRLETLDRELAEADAVPDGIAVKRGSLLDAIGTAESERSTASDARAEAETRLADADKNARAADADLSQKREDRARLQALSESAHARIEEIRSRIRDELEAQPEELAERAEIRDGEDLPTQEHADKRVEKLKNEREQLGGVNLRAEEEAAEHEQRLQTMTADRADLEGAVQSLRRGIQNLNREGRERLLESFEKVNANFQSLFTKLFQGGEAKLTFTESEDPLEAGLEIFARPPGKRLQSLQLLSGGEQALTAMALVFAVFLVNPAPVCVLDEVDAPLDDANVERFCDLLDEMTRLTSTRFLVITHHALTMSRMNRLFGVTMTERGVSQLVSVSLSEAEQVAAAE